jgi:hypothetical protein
VYLNKIQNFCASKKAIRNAQNGRLFGNMPDHRLVFTVYKKNSCSSTWKTEAGELRVQAQLEQHSETLSQKTKKK